MKRILIILTLFISLISLVSCKQIEDINGDDTSLATITEETLLSNAHTSTKIGTVYFQRGRKITSKASKFSGTEEIQGFTLKNTNITFKVSVTVTGGNFLAYIVKDGVIIKKFDNNVNDQVFTIEQDNSSVYFRIAGESAKYSLEFEYDK